jgi:hypothetical protein
MDLHERTITKYEDEFSRLANYLLEEFPTELSEGDRPVDIAIRLLTRFKRQILMQNVEI